MKEEKVDIQYFEKILNEEKLQIWVSDLLFDRLNVFNTVTYNDNGFCFLFSQNQLNLTLSFTQNGRNGLFENNYSYCIIPNVEIEKLEFVNFFETDLIAFGIKTINWFCKKGDDKSYLINYDLPSYLIWALNRIEEYGVKSLDLHDRFELQNSHLKIDNLFKRPIVDEWFLFIKNLLVSEGFSVKKDSFQFEVSHDVDVISRYKSVPFIRLFPVLVIDLFRRPNYLLKFIFNQNEFVVKEHTNKFDWLMDVSDKFGIKSKFYFIAGNTSYRFDFLYILHSNFVKKLLLKIHKRKHIIGIHYSYNSSLKKTIIVERKRLDNLLTNLKIPKIDGGRMHYLRWNFLDTLNQLEEALQEYDNTMTFFEGGGFRAGTCMPYKPFDIFNLRQMNIVIRPLIIMEGSVLNYSGINDKSEAYEYVKDMVDKCFSVNGCFSLLWHNSDLQTSEEQELYFQILSYCNDLNVNLQK